jgi:ComF family protein
LAEYFGYLYGLKLLQQERYQNLDLIIPVPLHSSKLRKRGYNQSAYFGRGLSRAMNIPLREDILVRKKATVSQTGKGRVERYENVDDIFDCNEVILAANVHILLVDDVLTTGATIVSAALTLLNAVDCRVSIATLARA